MAKKPRNSFYVFFPSVSLSLCMTSSKLLKQSGTSSWRESLLTAAPTPATILLCTSCHHHHHHCYHQPNSLLAVLMAFGVKLRKELLPLLAPPPPAAAAGVLAAATTTMDRAFYNGRLSVKSKTFSLPLSLFPSYCNQPRFSSFSSIINVTFPALSTVNKMRVPIDYSMGGRKTRSIVIHVRT